EAGVMGPFLVVAPLSTIHNWEREFETWSDINAVVYHGTSASRQMIRDYEMYFHDDKGIRVKKPYKFDALITTFEMVLADCDELKEIPFRMCVIDEAHRLKNRNCKLLTGGFSAFQMEHRVLLTGTPLQNNIDELFSLLNFLEPKQFASSEAFLSEFGQCKTDEQVNKLQEILKPMMLRRLKEDVEKALKPKEETIIEVELSNIQKKYYRAILERNFSYLCKGASAPSLMNTMMELRKCCNHPFLINGAEEQILAEQRTTHPSTDPDELAHTAL
uniref:Helicase ATP-binding domain-containing protein n=2 Tax=Plectus sambesii TaxID=2011161 RepID=A0A914V259_9BILA